MRIARWGEAPGLGVRASGREKGACGRVSERIHSVVTGRDRLGCFNVPGVLAAAEPGAAPDRGRMTVSRYNKLLQRPRQVSFGVGRRTTLSHEGTHGSSDGRGRASALGADSQQERS